LPRLSSLHLPDAVRFEPLRRQGEEFGGRGQIPIGIADVCMTEIGGQLWQALLDVVAAAVPMEQGPDGEAVAQIMRPWAVMILRRPQADLVGQDDEGAAHTPRREPCPLLGEKKARCRRCGIETVAPLGIAGKPGGGVGCSGSQRDFPNFAPRMLRLPWLRSTSARSNPTGSLMRIR